MYSGAKQSSPAEPPALRKLYSKGAVFIGENVWLGEYVSILPGARIGDGVIVGANSTVSGELPANTICVGSPARPVKIFSSEKNAWVPFQETKL
ncbi:Streptogramin A acetyltransferase [compost metagenome]